MPSSGLPHRAVDLFLIRFDARDDAAIVSALPADERRALDGLRHPAVRVRRARSLWLRRALLASRVGGDPAELRFEIGEHDRPRLFGNGPDFNLSHCGDEFALGIAPDGIGVDLESTERPRDWPRLAEQVLDAHERRRFPGDPDEQARTVIRYWTLKEAWLKGLGTGISGGLQCTAIRGPADRPRGERPELGPDHGWRLGQCWLTPQRSLAWAVRGAAGIRVRPQRLTVTRVGEMPRLQPSL